MHVSTLIYFFEIDLLLLHILFVYIYGVNFSHLHVRPSLLSTCTPISTFYMHYVHMYGGGGLFCPIALLTFTHYLYMYHTCMDMQTTKLEIVKKGEFGGVRSPNAFECCKNCIAAEDKRRSEPPKPGRNYAQFEADRSERLKEKGPLVCKYRHNIYVTDSATEVEERVNGGFPREKIVLTDRLSCGEAKGCDGSKSFWAFESLRKALANLGENRYQLEMIFMPCFCKACRQLEDVKLWEQEHETDFTGPWPRPCPYQADISSKILPERPADLPPRAKHLFRRMMGSIKVIPHVSIPDNQLYAFISQLKPNANPTDREPYLQAAETLKNLCRSRNLTIRDSRSQGGSSSKRAMIKKLMEYLDKKDCLPENAQWPQPELAAPDAAGPDGGNL
jgi:hypothetical protein